MPGYALAIVALLEQEYMKHKLSGQAVVELIAQAKSGNAEALNRICDWLRPQLAKLCRNNIPHFLGSKVDESDLIQESLIGISQSLQTFRGLEDGDLLAWARGIAENKALEMQRRFFDTEKRDVKREQSISQFDSTHVGTPQSNGKSPVEVVVAAEEAAQIQALVLNLRSDYRELIQLRHINDLSFLQIAERLGKSEDSVKNAYIRAMKTLQRFVDEANHK